MSTNKKSFFVAIAGAIYLLCWNAYCGKTNLRNLPITKKPRFKVADRGWMKQYGEAEVCLWKDDKLAAFSFTIDDNNQPDHEYWLKLGDKYGWKWTWFVIVNRIKEKPGYYGTWRDFQKLIDKGHDVQSHTISHRDPKLNMALGKDYGEAREEIDKHLKNNRCLTMAYPGGALPNDEALAKKYYVACRGVVGRQNRVAMINYMNTSSIGNCAGFFKPIEHWASFAGMVVPNNKLKFRNWYCAHFHTLSNEYAKKHKLKEHLEKVLRKLDKHRADIWVGKFKDVARYGEERDTALLSIDAVTPDSISLSLSDGMEDDLFDYPLSVKVRLNSNWKGIKATQGGKPIKARIIRHENAFFALVDVIPDKGAVVLVRLDSISATAN